MFIGFISGQGWRFIIVNELQSRSAEDKQDVKDGSCRLLTLRAHILARFTKIVSSPSNRYCNVALVGTPRERMAEARYSMFPNLR